MIYEFLTFRRATVRLSIDRAANNNRSQSSNALSSLAFHPRGSPEISSREIHFARL
jgi:hypothetical protein